MIFVDGCDILFYLYYKNITIYLMVFEVVFNMLLVKNIAIYLIVFCDGLHLVVVVDNSR